MKPLLSIILAMMVLAPGVGLTEDLSIVWCKETNKGNWVCGETGCTGPACPHGNGTISRFVLYITPENFYSDKTKPLRISREEWWNKKEHSIPEVQNKYYLGGHNDPR